MSFPEYPGCMGTGLMYCIIRRHTKDGCGKQDVETEGDYVELGQVLDQGAVMSQHCSDR